MTYLFKLYWKESLVTMWDGSGNTRSIMKFSRGDRRYFPLVLIIIMVSLIVKTSVLLNNEIISNDGPRYINQARQFLDGNFFDSIKHESMFFYSLLISLFGYLGADLVFSGKMISLLSSILALIPLYLIFEKIGNSQVAMWACLAFATNPVLNKFSVSVMRDSLFLLLVACLLFFLWRAYEQSLLRDCFIVAVLCLLSALVRIEGILFIPLTLLGMVLLVFSPKHNRIRRLKCLGCYSFPFILIATLLCLYILFVNGYITRLDQLNNYMTRIVEQGLFAHQTSIDEGLSIAQAKIGPMPENDFIQIVKDNVALIYLVGLFRLLVNNMWWPFSVFCCYGLFARRENLQAEFFLAATVCAYLLMAYIFNVHTNFLDERYLFVPTLLLSFWVGKGLSLAEVFFRPRIGKMAVFCTLSLLFVASSVYSVRAMLPQEATSSREAGLWLARQPSLSQLSVVANGERVPFYAGLGDNCIRTYFFSDFQRQITLRSPELLLVETRHKNADNANSFSGYELLARFDDRKYAALIFRKKAGNNPERLLQ